MSRIHPKYQTFWPRLAASIADGLIFLPLSLAGMWLIENTSNRLASTAILLVLSSAFLVYNVILHGLYGQTIGKKLCRVIVLDISESPLTIKQALIRDSPSIVATIILLPFDLYKIWQGIDPYDIDYMLPVEWWLQYVIIGWSLAEFVTMLFNSRRRALHDYLAGSVVMREEQVGESPIFA